MNDLKTLSVDCAGRTASVEIRGEGPDVVFVGAATPMLLSRATAVALAGMGYRVIDFDYGLGHPQPEARTALGQVSDVRTVMDASGASDAAVVGLSRGAVTAFAVAAAHPAVAALVLAFPVAGFADTIYETDPDPSPLPGESEEAFMRRSLERLFTAAFVESHWAELVELVTASPGSVRRVKRSEETPFPDGLTVDVPVLVVEAESDQIVTATHPARYREHLPDSGHVLVPDARHGWLMEDPGGFARILDEFLSSI